MHCVFHVVSSMKFVCNRGSHLCRNQSFRTSIKRQQVNVHEGLSFAENTLVAFGAKKYPRLPELSSTDVTFVSCC